MLPRISLIPSHKTRHAQSDVAVAVRRDNANIYVIGPFDDELVIMTHV